ncbi:hypothetical protein BFL38_13870 [Brachyspira hampsonii]|uniref:Lipocalin-like domain-containing protein n=1 Tax=Brachyspira hampsonii TaxID=1287055 RepID=A0A1E5NGV4_9SPIR|nr:hypothetical protein [Brachyspira hampsonii]OEJ15374.1 hypothetical protein BFL38_13870 [Brachyspira hampsonii]
MMKKLFLFTLLVSSFLVISCSNKDTTSPTGTGIEQQYRGYRYSGDASYSMMPGVPMPTTITINSDGSITSSFAGGVQTVNFEAKNIFNNGGGKYTCNQGAGNATFTFSGTSLIFEMSGNNLAMSGTLTRN